MIFIKFGRWNSSAGCLFCHERIRWHGYRWTPFVRVRWRYPDKWWPCLAWKLPRRLVYWAAIRMWAHVTADEWGGDTDTGTDSLPFSELIGRWRKDDD